MITFTESETDGRKVMVMDDAAVVYCDDLPFHIGTIYLDDAGRGVELHHPNTYLTLDDIETLALFMREIK